MTISQRFLAGSVEQSLLAWFRQQRGVPGLELHADRGAVWMVHPGVAWGNAAAGLRLRPENLGPRLDQMIARYRANGRGAGFWLSELATPANLAEELARRGFRCRKHFPGMYCDLARDNALPAPPEGMEIGVVEDHAIFHRTPHPYYGNITTPIRRFELARLAHLARRRPRRVWEFAATHAGVPVGVVAICLGPRVAGVFELGVLPDHRRRGIGAALVGHACAFARARRMTGIALIASGLGEGVYRRAGFEEVCRMSYWYSSLGRSQSWNPGQSRT